MSNRSKESYQEENGRLNRIEFSRDKIGLKLTAVADLTFFLNRLFHAYCFDLFLLARRVHKVGTGTVTMTPNFSKITDG